jgi:DNA-binding response OmpR family regulator
VDDDEDFCHFIAETLLDAGFEVVEAADGDQAVNILDQLGQLDLLVTDIDIPGRFDGNCVATRARSLHPDLSIVYISGCPDRLTNRVGPHDTFIGKPFHSSRMLSEVKRLLGITQTVA